MAVYYNRLKLGNQYAGLRALNTNSNAVIAISAGPILDVNLVSGVTLNLTGGSAAVSANEGLSPAGG